MHGIHIQKDVIWYNNPVNKLRIMIKVEANNDIVFSDAIIVTCYIRRRVESVFLCTKAN